MIAEAENVEFVHENLKRYDLHNGKIIVFEPDGAQRDTVDAWKKFTIESANNQKADQPFYEIHDMRRSTITPYARQKAIELVQTLANIEGRSAIIIANTHMGQMIGFFVNNVFNRFNRIRERKVFTDFETALMWIEADLD